MITSFFAAFLLFSAVSCENGVCRLIPDEPELGSVPTQTALVKDAEMGSVPRPARVAQGVMGEEEFLQFLSGDRPQTGDEFAGKGLVWILLLAVLGGLALNLTPCVLPMVPVNLIVIGASARRGLLYGLGQFLAFGTLGLAAALGGAAFGTIQSSPWFNLAVAILFGVLAVSLTGVLPIDFSRFRRHGKADAFLLGAVSALLAGACIAPVLVSVLLLTARLAAEGSLAGYALPFAVAFGLALPWPFLGAGLKILPKPGAWMRWVNRAFALFLIALAVHYGWLAFRGLERAEPLDAHDLSVESFRTSPFLAEPRARPLLVFCHADWCHNCPAMERLMATSKSVRRALAAYDVVRLKIESPDELKRLPGLATIQGLPAFAVYPPQNR